MRIIKPYGRSRTDRAAGTDLRRALETSARAQGAGASPRVEIIGFATGWPDLVIGQWISAIDKIASKPKGDKGAAEAQRFLRGRLGDACWDRLTRPEIGMLAGVDLGDRDRLAAAWSRRIHPYGEKLLKQRLDKNGKPLPQPRYQGKWYARFCGVAAHDAVDAVAVAKEIEGHLTKDALRLHGGTRRAKDGDAAPRGLIVLRALSIQRNVLRPPLHLRASEDSPDRLPN